MSKAEALFKDFHGREPRFKQDMTRFPKSLVRVGTLHRIDYLSDKRDPGDPAGEGRQGVWKHFTHEADKRPGLFDQYGYTGKGGKKAAVRWPAKAIWLGYVIELEYVPEGERSPVVEKLPKGTGLYAFEDGSAAFIVRNASDILLIRGSGFVVEGRGLVG